jgi:hypothetical protein
VRKILFLISLVLAVAGAAMAVETLTMTDGSTQSGDIIKTDDNGLMLRSGDVYTPVPWGKLSQDTLKHLAENPKIRQFVEVFIEPDQSQRPAKPEIKVNPVTRLERPANPSLFGGLLGSPVGLFILFVLYVANLYAGYEISIVRARSALQVVGLAAVLPVIGPVIFLCMPIKVDAPPEEASDAAAVAAAAGESQKPAEEIQIVDASWRQEEKKSEVQVFARGKFTFNKRFMETKFAGYIGEPKGDALKFNMEVKTAQAQLAVARITQVAATDVSFLTVPTGQATVPLAEILEIRLIPKPA